MAGRKSSDGVNRYMMRQKIVAFGDDFYIENERGEQVFHIDGKVLTIRDTLVFQDMQGRELCRIKEQLVKIKDTMNIQGPDGKTFATVKKDLINVLRDHWTVKVKDNADLDVKGNVFRCGGRWILIIESGKAAKMWPGYPRSFFECEILMGLRFNTVKTMS